MLCGVGRKGISQRRGQMIYKLPSQEFKEAIQSLIEKHFAPSIAKKFQYEYEVNLYNLDRNKNLQQQMKDRNFILEVRYQTSDVTSQYICDVCSWWSKAYTEAHLLQYITDKVVKGKMGKDWVEKDGKISEDILSGKHQTLE